MSYAIVSDVHLHNWSPFSTSTDSGINSRLEIILNALREATNALKSGDRLYITGDLFHVRGHITPSVLNPTLDLFKELIKRNIIIRIIPGNHDLESKNTSALTNAVQALESIGCFVCNESSSFPDDMVVMVPWIDNLDELRAVLKGLSKDAGKRVSEYTLMIHAPLNDVIPIPDHGLSPEELASLNFKRVFCGHYHHHKEFKDGIYSVGALTHQTWSDVGTLAGFITVNDKDEVRHRETAAPKFSDFGEIEEEEDANFVCTGNYVRVQLGEATEKEIREIREAIINEYGAAGCVVKSTPKPIGVTRSATISSGASIENSIEDWIKNHLDLAIHAKVNQACADILKETSTSE